MRIRWALFLLLPALAASSFAQQAPALSLEQQMLNGDTQRLAQQFDATVQKFKDLARAHADVLERRRDDYALLKLQLEKTAILLSRYSENPDRNKMAWENLDSANRSLALLGANQPFPPDPSGLVEKAYLSDVDDSAQPYYLYRPDNLDPKKPVPLIIFLHGYVGTLDKVTWMNWTFARELPTLADRTNAIVLVPFARSNTDFQGVGEKDVLDCIAKTLASTPADPDRVFLGGVSMGGSGVWTVASHNPDLFAGAFPVAGRTDYYLWKNLKRDELPRFESFLLDKEFSITFPQNFINLPVRCYHATEDFVVSVDHSREMQRALRDVHAPIDFRELADSDHNDWSRSFGDESLVRWIKTNKRNRFPDTVRFKLLELRHNRAYWITIDRIDKWGSPAEITAKRLSRNRIKVTTANVGALTLHLDRKEMRLAPQVTVEINGVEHVIDLADQADAPFALTEPGKLFKRQGLCGPFYELLEHRFLVVCPSKGDPQSLRRDQILTAKFFGEWRDFSAGQARLKYDADVTDRDIAESNLILFGTPATNALLARIADRFPIKFVDGNYVVGKQTFSDKLGLVFVYPNPLNPNRMVAVCSGLPYGEKLSVNHKYDLIPDYIVFEETPEGEGVNWFRCAGLFDSNWQLDEALMETRGPAPPPQQPGTMPAPGLVPEPAPSK